MAKVLNTLETTNNQVRTQSNYKTVSVEELYIFVRLAVHKLKALGLPVNTSADEEFKKKVSHMTKETKIKLGFVIFSLFIARISFNFLYTQSLKLLPNLDLFLKGKDSGSLEIDALRKAYNSSFNIALLESMLIFVLTIIVLEYIRVSNNKRILNSIKNVYTAFGAWKERQKRN